MTPEKRREAPRFKTTSDSVADTPYNQALEDLAISAVKWTSIKNTVSHEEETNALRTLIDRNQILAVSLRKNLSTGTLRFRSDSFLPSPTKSKSNIEQLYIEIYRKVLGRGSGNQFFKLLRDKITKITNNTYITEKGKISGKISNSNNSNNRISSDRH